MLKIAFQIKDIEAEENMIKLINIQANGSSIRVDALIEGEKDNSFEIVFDKNGEILSSTANEKQNYYKAQARIAFRKYVGKHLPKEIYSMWY